MQTEVTYDDGDKALRKSYFCWFNINMILLPCKICSKGDQGVHDMLQGQIDGEGGLG